MMRRRISGVNDPNNIRQLKRSRIEADHLGFRLLDHGQQQYYLGVPEPPRAPEPYKISAASSSMSRAHRRSSFVILAESGQVTSKSVGGSPIHERNIRSPMSPNRVIHGRSSPFRPRGFKGPLPHAQSRPPSPPPRIPRRFVQAKSLSQGNSPRKQSLIPQPRGGLIAKDRIKETKNIDRDRWERRSGRRVTTRIPRSSSLKALPAKRAIESTPRGTTKPLVKSTIGNSNKAKVTAIVTDKKANRSPTKIPIRHTPSGRFIQVANVESGKKEADLSAQKLPINLTPHPVIPVTDNSSSSTALATATAAEINSGPLSTVNNNNNNNSKQLELIKDDAGLVDLLKQSSTGSGAPSVVNATTTTAVQPLRIDAAKILPAQEINKIHTIKEEDRISSRSDTPEVKSDIGKIQKVVKNPGQKRENNSESIKPIAIAETIGESMNVEAVIETIRNDINDIKDTKENKIKKENKKDVMEIDKDEKKLKANEKSDKLRLDSSAIGTTSMNNLLIEKQEINESNPSSESPVIQSQDKLRNHDSETSLKSSTGLSTGSVESIRSTDTGVSLNTVRGVSSAREKRGTHIVKRTQEIETLSGNVINLENQQNGEPAVVEVTEPITSVDQSTINKQPKSRTERFTRWKSSFVKRFRDRWSTTKSNRGMKLFSWQRKIKKNSHNVQPSQKQQQQQQQQQQQSITEQSTTSTSAPNACSRFKAACWRSIRWRSKIAPAETTSCCHVERSCGLLCKSRRNWCRWPSCCCSCRREPERNRSIRAKHSLTSVAPPPLSEEQKSKIPDVLVEHNSVMRGAIPCLPVPLAWFCLIWNVLIPGSGTLWSGLFNLCIGQPRFSATASAKSRFGALIVNIIVGASQFFTVLFCLVGWGWSVWWGVTMIRLARKWKRFKAAEATNGDPEARGNEGILPAPGVAAHALRGNERAR